MSIELPFLKAICWQTADIKQLTPAEMLSRYEQGWHYRGVLGQPSALIDLAMQRIAAPLPPAAIDKAETAYPVIEPLHKAIRYFHSHPKFRDKCFQSLQVQIPEIIIEGLYLLAADFAVELAPNQQE